MLLYKKFRALNRKFDYNLNSNNSKVYEPVLISTIFCKQTFFALTTRLLQNTIEKLSIFNKGMMNTTSEKETRQTQFCVRSSRTAVTAGLQQRYDYILYVHVPTCTCTSSRTLNRASKWNASWYRPHVGCPVAQDSRNTGVAPQSWSIDLYRIFKHRLHFFKCSDTQLVTCEYHA